MQKKTEAAEPASNCGCAAGRACQCDPCTCKNCSC